jgi:hypothetical protein
MRAIEALGSAAVVGAALLGATLVLFDESALARLGLLAGVVALLGGTFARAERWSEGARVGLAVATVAGVRLAADTVAAGVAALLVSAGWLLRLGARDGVLALATYGVVLALVGGVSLRLALGFGLLGVAGVALGVGLRALRHRAALSRSPGRTSRAREGAPSPAVGSEEVVS